MYNELSSDKVLALGIQCLVRNQPIPHDLLAALKEKDLAHLFDDEVEEDS